MSKKATLKQEDNISIIKIDDGKVNIFSIDLIETMNTLLKEVPKDKGALIITGREGSFSAGFDLKTFTSGNVNKIQKMAEGGYNLLETLFDFERPIVMAASGHAIGLGVFLLCCADYRIGAKGNFKIHANEVVNGMVIPSQMMALAEYRVLPTHLNRMFINGEAYPIEEATKTGILDDVVDEKDLLDVAKKRAKLLCLCQHPFYKETKRIARAETLKKIRQNSNPFLKT